MVQRKQRSSRKMPSLFLFLLGWTLLFTGCAVQKQRVQRPPASVPEQRVIQAEPVTPMEENAVVEETVPPPHGVAASLQKSAGETLAAGRFSQAETLVERALRLEPGNPELWHMMGRVKSGQNNPAQTVQFCLKSNSLAAGNLALTRRNWLLMEKSYHAMGQEEQAADARRKAKSSN
jgi:tetratricopeptide (TPR) repeat protein